MRFSPGEEKRNVYYTNQAHLAGCVCEQSNLPLSKLFHIIINFFCMNASLCLFARGCEPVCAKMASRKYPFLNRIQDKNRTKSQSQLQHPSLSQHYTERALWVPWKASEKWKRSWCRRRGLEKMERDFSRKGKCANLSFTYIQVVIFRLSYVRVHTANHVCLCATLFYYLFRSPLTPRVCLYASGTLSCSIQIYDAISFPFTIHNF